MPPQRSERSRPFQRPHLQNQLWRSQTAARRSSEEKRQGLDRSRHQQCRLGFPPCTSNTAGTRSEASRCARQVASTRGATRLRSEKETPLALDGTCHGWDPNGLCPLPCQRIRSCLGNSTRLRRETDFSSGPGALHLARRTRYVSRCPALSCRGRPAPSSRTALGDYRKTLRTFRGRERSQSPPHGLVR